MIDLVLSFPLPSPAAFVHHLPCWPLFPGPAQSWKQAPCEARNTKAGGPRRACSERGWWPALLQYPPSSQYPAIYLIRPVSGLNALEMSCSPPGRHHCSAPQHLNSTPGHPGLASHTAFVVSTHSAVPCSTDFITASSRMQCKTPRANVSDVKRAMGKASTHRLAG